MARVLLWVFIAAVLVGGAIWVAGRSTEKPLTRIEKTISVNALSR